MCDDDRERYGGPEWVEIAHVELLDEETGLLEQVEDVFDIPAGVFLRKLSGGSLRALRAVIWLARAKAGCQDDPRTFRPKVMDSSGITWEPLPGEDQAEVAGPVPPANRAGRRAAARPRKAAPSGT